MAWVEKWMCWLHEKNLENQIFTLYMLLASHFLFKVKAACFCFNYYVGGLGDIVGRWVKYLRYSEMRSQI
jgi:hypothetical protein